MNANNLYEAVRYIRSKTYFLPYVSVVLGSGLGDLATLVKAKAVFSAREIPYYPHSSVPGHAGKLIFGYIEEGKKKSPPLLVFQGRVHFYETGSLEDVIAPVQLAQTLGAKLLLITNAAGGINKQFVPGDIMLIRDFLNLTFLTLPKVGTFQKEKSQHSALSFPDAVLASHLRSCALREKIRLQEGTYCWLRGPTYETAAEIQMLKQLGADAVGMSTVPEIYAALQLKMKVAALSLISNLGTGISHTKLSHEEVTETANRAKEKFVPFIKRVLLTLTQV